MATLTRSFVALSCAVAIVSCGDSLVDDRYRGAPLASLQIDVFGTLPGSHPRAAVFWAESLTDRELSTLQEQLSTGQALEAGRSYLLNLFDPPERTIAWSAGDPDGPAFSIGRIRAYEDANDNARYDAGESIIGGVFPLAVLWAAEDLPAGKGPSPRALKRGLHVTLLPLPCDYEKRPNPPIDARCEVPLGAPCRVDGECGAGKCVSETAGLPWPGGACLAPLRMDACRPPNTVQLPGAPDDAYWGAACESDADCGRDGPYRCDVLLGVCAPLGATVLSLDAHGPTIDFCPPAGALPGEEMMQMGAP